MAMFEKRHRAAGRRDSEREPGEGHEEPETPQGEPPDEDAPELPEGDEPEPAQRGVAGTPAEAAVPPTHVRQLPG